MTGQTVSMFNDRRRFVPLLVMLPIVGGNLVRNRHDLASIWGSIWPMLTGVALGVLACASIAAGAAAVKVWRDA